MIGNYADALSSYRKAIELEPDNPETLTRLSAFLDRLGTVDAAAAKRGAKGRVDDSGNDACDGGEDGV